MENKYYFEFDIDYDVMPYRIYKKSENNPFESIEIAKCYEKEDAQLIVDALNSPFGGNVNIQKL